MEHLTQLTNVSFGSNFITKIENLDGCKSL